MNGRSADANAPARRCGLTRLEWLVVIGCVAILISLTLPNSSTRRQIERRVRDWQPAHADTVRPDRALLVNDLDVVGTWIVRRRFNGSSMTLTRETDGTFSLNFFTHGCLGSCNFTRRASFHDGVLTLDQPVSEYLPVVYKTLYAVRIDEEELLLPAAFVTELRGVLSEPSRKPLDGSIMRMYVFRRGDPHQAEGPAGTTTSVDTSTKGSTFK